MVATAQQQQQKQGAPAVVGATKISAEEEALKRNTDCVYFLASPLTCKKGSECEYRHSEYARVNPRDCYYWLNGNCLNPKCAFRHPPLDGLLGTQVAAPAGSSMPSSLMATTPAPAAYMSYNQGAPSTSSKQPVPCIFFQKGHCLKGDRCAFMHGPTTNNKAPQPSAAAFATEPHSVKKSFGATETPHSQKLSQNNVSKIVGVPPEDKPTPKVEAVSARSGAGIERTVQRPVGLNEELSRHKGSNITSVSVVNGGFVGRSNRLLQALSSDEQSFHAGKETDEFLRESSPGFDVLVDDDLRNSDFYHGEDQYGGAGGLEGRNVNEYDIVHSTNYDAMVEVDREMFPVARGSDSFDHLQGHYGRDQQRALSERTSLGLSALERRGYLKADNPDQFEESDLRYRLSKHRTVNGLRSVVSHDHDLENHEDERNYQGSFHRDSHHLSARENSLGSRLWGRIKLPGRSPVNGTEVQSKRDIERGKSWGRLSPGMPQTSSLHGRLRDRIKGRVEGDYNNKEGQNFKGQRIRREIIGEKNADFAGPKSLAELKVGKITENKEQQTLGKRKTIDNYEQNEGDPSFEGPMPLSEILKRKRQYEAASFGSGEACVNKEDMNQKQSNEGLIVSSFDRVVSATMEEVNSTIADGGTAAVAHGESSQVHNVSEHVTEDGLIAANERIEDHELDGDDQMDGDYYDQGEEGDYNYEEVENADPEEEFIEEEGEGEDGDDFEKKLGVMFS